MLRKYITWVLIVIVSVNSRVSTKMHIKDDNPMSLGELVTKTKTMSSDNAIEPIPNGSITELQVSITIASPVDITAVPTPLPTATAIPTQKQNSSEPRITSVNNKSGHKTHIATLKPVIKANNAHSEAYVRQRVCEVFGDACAEALIIAQHESSFRPGVISNTGDYGVMQINCYWQKKRVGGNCDSFLDLETNLAVAKQIYNEQGWGPWSTKIYLRK